MDFIKLTSTVSLSKMTFKTLFAMKSIVEGKQLYTNDSAFNFITFAISEK